MTKAEAIMERMGFPATETGPYVSALRKVIERQVSEGLVNCSAGTWARNDLTAEERARHLLAWEWAQERGHFYETKTMDPIAGWKHTFGADRVLRRRFYVRWHSIPAWTGDRIRELGMRWRVFRDRTFLASRTRTTRLTPTNPTFTGI